MKIISKWGYLVLFGLSFSLAAQQEETTQQENEEPEVVEQEVQEIKYVTDKLRLSLYKRADAGSGTIKLLISGDELEVLEKSGPYSKVRTKAGMVGWVKNGFLLPTPTDSFLLIEEQEKNRILAQQIEKYADSKQLVTDYENTIKQMETDTEKLTTDLEQARRELQNLSDENTALDEQLELSQQEGVGIQDVKKILMHYWYFAAAFGLFMILIGFTAGREVVESRIRRKFQGVKVW